MRMIKCFRHLFLLFGAIVFLLLSDEAVSASPLRKGTEETERNRRRRLEDTDTLSQIQTILDDSLSKTNFDLRKAMTDPLQLELAAAVPVGCGNLALEMSFDRLTGLSSIDLTSLTAQSGTESTFPDCTALPQTKWKSAVDIVVGFGSDIVSGQVGARLVGRCGGQRYNQPLTVSVTSTGNTFTGSSNMEGILGDVVDAIAKVDILGVLSLTSTISSTVALIPSALSAYESTITSQVEAAFRNQMVQMVEPHLRQKLERLVPSTPFSLINRLAGFLPDIVELVVGDLSDYFGGGDDDLLNLDDLLATDDGE
ncbi:expressed unknown protein [Seminavis robusta]|uniref:Uncharacterized protein n=1 Tax=Seminavis robusta TaxID=568900 RepID=A0A9N8HNX0_9STRA|nr:expressed unknown protein [Seminavis robusta]|eukprot:Sro856_g211610.1 n/a (311) ;mRNA; f:30855-31787